ncbi:MAG: DUF2125 domain-containing protein [Hasllibacter sp.]
MRRLLALVLVVAALWGVWWALGQTATERGWRAFLEQLEDEGWTVSYGDLATRGFPSRFDTTARDLALIPPAGPAVRLPFFQTLMLAYAPNRAIAVWPPAWTIGPLEVRSETLRASVGVGATPSLPLDRMTAVAERLAVAGDGWALRTAAFSAATERSDEAGNGHRLGLRMRDLLLPEFARGVVDPDGRLPARVDLLRIDAVAGFDAPWDRRAPMEGWPRPTSLSLEALEFDWGRLRLRAAGALAIDAAGVPEGRIGLTLVGWEDLLALGEATGIVAPEYAPLARQALAVLDGMDSGAEGIETELVFEGGRMTLGPLPLGAAPRLTY